MGGVRASKAHPRFEAMGDVDELNAAIGVAMAVQSDPRGVAVLRGGQNALFTVGAEVGRAERHAFTLARKEAVNPELLRYLNRLSSLLFTMAVWVQRSEGIAEEHPR